MFYKVLFLFITVLPSVKSALKYCNETSKFIDVCSLVGKYDKDYPSLPHPRKIELYIKILDIVDLDWHSNTITQVIQLWSLWNDSRISITENRNGYCYFNYDIF